jgi:hypothetical protein
MKFRYLTLAALLLVLGNCNTLNKAIKEDLENIGGTATAVFGEKTDRKNNYADLLAELRAGDAQCRESQNDTTNWVRCSQKSADHIRGIASVSGAIGEPDDQVWKITSDAKLAAFLTQIKSVRAQEADLKYRQALAALTAIPGASGNAYYKAYQTSLQEKALMPEKNLQRVLAALANPDKENLEDSEAAKLAREAFISEPELAQNAKYRNEYAAVARTISGKATCTFRFQEPPGKAYISTGYPSPIAAGVRCDRAATTAQLGIEVKSNGPVRFGSAEVKEFRSEFENNTAAIPVSELSVNQEDNKFEVKPVPRYGATFTALTPLGDAPVLELTATPAEYTLQKVPVFFSAAYEVLARGVAPSTPWKTLKGGETEATLGMNGQFTMGGKRDGVPYDMVFGHPNGKHSEGIWSSFITIKINDQLYRFDKIPALTRSESADHKNLVVTANIEKEQVTVVMTMQIAAQDNYIFGLEATNNSGETKQVGFRLLMDTWAGNTDGVPFLTPAAVTAATQIHRAEFRFTPAYSAVWETIDAGGDGYVYLRNTMTGPGLVAPDQVAFAQWGSAYRSEWEYKISSEKTILGDSAALLWWNPQQLSAAKSRKVATRFGVFQRTAKTLADVQDAKSGFGYIYLDRQNDTELPQTHRIELDSPNAQLETPGGLKQQFTLQAHERSVRAIPVTVVGSGPKQVTVKEFISKSEVPVTTVLTFDAPKDDGHSANIPVWMNTKPYPVRYVSNNPAKNLRCVLRSAADGAFLGEGALKLIKKDDVKKEYIYGVDVPVSADYKGQTVVDIFGK